MGPNRCRAVAEQESDEGALGQGARGEGVRPLGEPRFGDVVVHVFDAEAREYYNLEDLWADAPRVDWKRD